MSYHNTNTTPSDTITPRDWILGGSVLICTLIVGSYILFRRTQDYTVSSRAKAPMQIAMSAQRVIGNHPTFLGASNAAYTLVEFADYQCPPCRRANETLQNLLKRFPGRLRLTYRNYPLQKIHPQAQKAAICAETARIQGRFWEVHDSLYNHQDHLSDKFYAQLTLQKQEPAHPADQASLRHARENIGEDVEDGDALDIEGTPAFFLCGPDNRILRLGSLSQVADLLH